MKTTKTDAPKRKKFKTINEFRNELVSAKEGYEKSIVSLKSDKIFHLLELVGQFVKFVDKLPKEIRFGEFLKPD